MWFICGLYGIYMWFICGLYGIYFVKYIPILLSNINRMLYYLILFAVFLLLIILLGTRTEAFQTFKAALPNEIGGTVLSKITFNDHSTVVRKLLGNSDKTIILIHNSPFNYEVWFPLYMYTQGLLREGQKIPTLISYDLLGHGTAWQPMEQKYNDRNPQNVAWSFSEFSDDLYAIYKKYVIGGGKVTVAGYGFGGSVAEEFALNHPEVVEHLFILQTTIAPMTVSLPMEISYMAQWIANNQAVTYLTMDRTFVQKNICIWFSVNDARICPYPENSQDTENSYGTTEYLLGAKLFREAAAETVLQVDKLLVDTDFRERWGKARVDFPITLLTANRDHYVVGVKPEEEIKSVNKASPNATLYLVAEKHGFTLIHTKYIFKLLIGQDMSKDPLTIQTL